MTPLVSLVIKACFQGGELLDQQVRNIVKMLEKKRFCEVLLIFDSVKPILYVNMLNPRKMCHYSLQKLFLRME